LSYLKFVRKFLYDTGVRQWRIFTVFPVGRAASVPELRLSNGRFRELMDFIGNCRREGKIKVSYGCEGFLGGYEAEVRDGFFECAAGISVASVLADGSISGCPSIRANYHQGNIYKDNFWDVWNNNFEQFRNKEWARKGKYLHEIHNPQIFFLLRATFSIIYASMLI